MRKPKLLVTAAAGHTGAPAALQLLETIALRYAAARPEARRSLAGAGRALWSLLRILATPALDLDRVERVQGHPAIAGSELATDSESWRAARREQASGASRGGTPAEAPWASSPSAT